MSVKIRKIDIDQYSGVYGEMEGANIYVSPLYLSALSSVRKIRLFSIEKENRPEAVFPILEKRRFFAKAALQPPFTQYFNILRRKAEMNEREALKQREKIVGAYCEYLKKEYLLFSIPMHPYMQDMRIFQWRGIRVRPNYTYQIEAGPEGLCSVSGKIARKAKGASYEKIAVVNDFTEIFKALKSAYGGREPISRNDYIKLMHELQERKMLDVYADENGTLVLLRDDSAKTVYEYNVTGRESGALLYNALSQDCYRGWTFDFQGANTKSISMYKAWFSPSLVAYFRISRLL